MKTKTRKYKLLTKTEVKTIRALGKKGTTATTIAKRMKASRSNVYLILNRGSHTAVR